MDSITQALLIALFVALPMSMFWVGVKFSEHSLKIKLHDEKLHEFIRVMERIQAEAAEAFRVAENAIHRATEANARISQQLRRSESGGFVQTD